MTIAPSVPRSISAPPPTGRRPGWGALAAGLGFGGAAGVLAVVAVLTRPGQTLDQALMMTLSEQSGATRSLAAQMMSGRIVWFALACVVVALICTCMRPRRGGMAGPLVAFAGVNLTSQVVKSLLERPELTVGPHLSNSFPSGHAALAWGATCALVLAPRTWLRGLALPVAAVGSLLISIGVVAAGWHRPSDVLGAALLAAAWGWGVHGLTLLGGRPSGSGRRGRRWATPPRG